MAVMAHSENLVDGDVNGLPFVATAAKTRHRLFASGLFLSRSRNEARDRLPVPGNRHGLTVLYGPEDFRQASLGFGCLYGTHGKFQPVVITS